MPTYLPVKCENCNSFSRHARETGDNKLIVVTRDGRLFIALDHPFASMLYSFNTCKINITVVRNLNSTVYRCTKCSHAREATFIDYILSGYFPGNINNGAYLFSRDPLDTWFHLKHLTPGTSLQKYIEVLVATSKEHSRVRRAY